MQPGQHDLLALPASFLACECMQAALQAKLSAAGPDRTGPVNVALLRAIELCNHFAYADHEDMAQFEALKAQVKGALTQPLPDLYQVRLDHGAQCVQGRSYGERCKG